MSMQYNDLLELPKHNSFCKIKHELVDSDTEVKQEGIQHCAFGKKCIFVTMKNDNEYLNKPEYKTCKFLHENESKESYLTRTCKVINTEPMTLDTTGDKWVTIRNKDIPINIISKRDNLINRVESLMRKKLRIINIKIED